MCVSGRHPFPAGGRVTFNGKECICEKCTQPVPVNSKALPQAVHSECSVFLLLSVLFMLFFSLNACNETSVHLTKEIHCFYTFSLFADCCGCGKEFENEQSLVALDKHWHLGCFKCKVCNKVLNAEYISKSVPVLLSA